MTAGGVSPLTARHEFARKALHLLWAAVPLVYAGGVQRGLLIVLLGASVLIALVVEFGRMRVPIIGNAFMRVTRPLLRAHEHHQWSGATWLLISFLLLVLIFPPSIAIAGMWAVSVGDASAALIGRAVGRRRFPGSSKTLIGSTACAVTTFAGLLLVADLSTVESVIGGLIAAGAEWPIGLGDDNIRIGIAVATGILLSHMAFS